MQVSLSFGSSEVRPGEKLSLTVSAHRESYVGVLAVDQSVLLLKGGNDITQDMVTSSSWWKPIWSLLPYRKLLTDSSDKLYIWL